MNLFGAKRTPAPEPRSIIYDFASKVSDDQIVYVDLEARGAMVARVSMHLANIKPRAEAEVTDSKGRTFRVEEHAPGLTLKSWRKTSPEERSQFVREEEKTFFEKRKKPAVQ